MKRFLILTTITLSLITIASRMFSENLQRENGEISASILPLDAQVAKIDYQTATFGMG